MTDVMDREMFYFSFFAFQFLSKMRKLSDDILPVDVPKIDSFNTVNVDKEFQDYRMSLFSTQNARMWMENE